MRNSITTAENVDRIASSLKGKKTGSGWICLCPAHNDKTPSLSLSLSSDDKILFKCHAGCTQNEVYEALKIRKLLPSHQRGEAPKTEYLYFDKTGAPALKVTRIDKGNRKIIFQESFEYGAWNKGGTKLELRPYLFEEWGGDTSLPVYLVEGEKCALALKKIGLNATTTPGGSQSWRSYFSDYFKDRKVIILPDHDEAGIRYAEAAYSDLKDVAQTIKVVDLPGLQEKEDVYDWLQRGNTKEDLEILVNSENSSPLGSTELKSQDDEPLVTIESTIPNRTSISEDSLYGLAGDFVYAVEPHTESDVAALLVQFLVGFGNIIGRTAHIQIGASKHYGNLYAALVGDSSVGRKGTAWELVALVLKEVDSQWWSECRIFGLGSGEGLVAAVKDPDMPSTEELKKDHPKFEKPRDKRGMVIEGEFGQVLKVFQREGSTLSPQVRNAWDGGDLRVTTKKDSLRSTGAHISIVGHITKVELSKLLSESDMFNGIGNRFMWVTTTRSKLLPIAELPDRESLNQLISRTVAAVKFAKCQDVMNFSKEAEVLWKEIYWAISVERPGLYGVLTGRAAPMIRRISMLYALLDESSLITPAHLKAALGVWQHSEKSVVSIFGKSTGDKHADRLLHALMESKNGLTQTEIINEVFARNLRKDQVAKALKILLKFHLAHSTVEQASSGRKVIRWRFCSTNYEFNDFTDPDPMESCDFEGGKAANSSNSYFVKQSREEETHAS